MKLEYFILLPNDICGSLQSFSAIALWRKVSHSSMRLYDGATLIVWCTVKSSCRMHFKPKVNGILDTLHFTNRCSTCTSPQFIKEELPFKTGAFAPHKNIKISSISSDVWKLSAQHSNTENIKVKERKQLQGPLFKYSVPT